MVDYFKRYIKSSYWAFFDKLAEKIFADALEKGDIFSENPLGYDPSHIDKDIFFVYSLSDKLNNLYAENGGYYQKYIITVWQWCQDLKNNKETHFDYCSMPCSGTIAFSFPECKCKSGKL